MVLTNHLLTGMILQVVPTVTYPPMNNAKAMRDAERGEMRERGRREEIFVEKKHAPKDANM